MTSATVTSFDLMLELVVRELLKYKVTDPIALTLDQAQVHTFEQFHSINIDDLHVSTYMNATAATSDPGETKIKEVQTIKHVYTIVVI